MWICLFDCYLVVWVTAAFVVEFTCIVRFNSVVSFVVCLMHLVGLFCLLLWAYGLDPVCLLLVWLDAVRWVDLFGMGLLAACVCLCVGCYFCVV